MSKLACLGRVVSVLGAMLSPSIGGAQTPPIEELDAVAMIRVFAPSTGQGRKEGSGILLGPDGFVLTARHVVGDVDRATERITVTFISASGNPIEAEFRDCAAGDSDVCLLKIPASAVRAAGVTAFPRLNCRRLEVNDMVLAVGWPNPAHMELDRVSGTITGGLATGVLYPTSATALPGMSGGPVYDQTDTVVGLVKGGLEPTQTRVLLVPLFSVRDLIEQTPEDCPVPEQPRIPASLPFSDRCIIRGMDILIDSQGLVFSEDTKQVSGDVFPPFAPFCAFDIMSRQSGMRYCVTRQDGTILTGQPLAPVGSCRKCIHSSCPTSWN